ncbi:hypothetical protein FIU87_06405 [Bacillus sp. THAF10]|uniref:hypothetical protein n=1 Tax=Bacillus sp. THAF10 TaxID=2587848 RepID=UPI001268CED6|nr:hypothetical protein [Bacillus sp. THAF10]QFT88267.1 hypothetical protein FIU87_06405 [Bacillus sp. THAF10]
MYREHKPINLSPYDHPDIYPGPRPASSFLFWQGRAHRLNVHKDLSLAEQEIHLSKVDHILGSLAFHSQEKVKVGKFFGEKSWQEKVPVIAYGSNVCLAQLQYKFQLRPAEDDAFLCIKGEIVDSDIVYAPFLAPYGSLPAVIAPVQGANCEVWVTFIDKKQLELINSTEKGYEFREHAGKKVHLDTGEVYDKVYAYYYPEALLWQGDLRRFADIPGSSRLKSVWQCDMLNELKHEVEHKGTREEFIHLLRWDRSYRDFVEDYLQRNCTFRFEHPDWQPCEQIITIGEMRK